MLAAAAGSQVASIALWALAVVLVLLAGAGGEARRWTSPSGIAVLAYAALIAINNGFVSPSYSAAGIYVPLLFAVTFFSLRRLRTDTYGALYSGALLAAAGFAAWGLWQVAAGTSRADAGFESANTLATLLNLALVPALLLLVRGRASAPLALAAAILFAGMLATGSRGGLLGLLAGCGVALFMARRLALAGPPRWQPVGAAVLVGVMILALLRTAGPALTEPAGGSARAPAETAQTRIAAMKESSLARVELYALSLDAARGSLLTGTGYLTFRSVLERGRERVPAYGAEDVTYFVHNDYLQTLQELGLAGLAALLALVIVPVWMAVRGQCISRPERERLMLAAAAGSAASMAAQALVDFPFYVPVCLLLFGAALAVSDRIAVPAEGASGRGRSTAARAAKAACAALIAFYASLPLAAERAAHYGRQQFLAGETRSAAYWLEVSRRLQPRDWRYHWYAGQFWFAQALAKRSPEAARLARDAFGKGAEADPLEPRNIMGVIETARSLRGLAGLEMPPAELDALSARALALAPLNPDVRRERVLALEFAGRRDEALRLAQEWAPGDAQLAALAGRLRHGAGR